MGSAQVRSTFEAASSGQLSVYFHSTMRGRKPESYHAIRAFGAIGNGISLAIGVAAARKDGKTVLCEGDGSLLLHIQELEMVQRHRVKLLICVLNDGAYGSEVHNLRADGIDDGSEDRSTVPGPRVWNAGTAGEDCPTVPTPKPRGTAGQSTDQRPQGTGPGTAD